jgi:hypothetical protein
MDIDKITNLINDKLYSWSEALIKLAQHRTAVVVMVIGFISPNSFRKITYKLIDKVSKKHHA